MRHRVAKARIVTAATTYVRYEFLIDGGTAVVKEQVQRGGAVVRTLTHAGFANVDGVQRVAGTNEDGQPEVWTVDRHGCQGCGGGMTTHPTIPDEVPA